VVAGEPGLQHQAAARAENGVDRCGGRCAPCFEAAAAPFSRAAAHPRSSSATITHPSHFPRHHSPPRGAPGSNQSDRLLARPFREGMAAVVRADRAFYIDRRGRPVMDQGYDVALSFSEGLAAVREEGSRLFGYIDASGAYVIPPQFRTAGIFSEGLAHAQTNDAIVFINHAGEFVIEIPGPATTLTRFQSGRAFVGTRGKYGYIDHSGTWIWSTPDEMNENGVNAGE
jgi:hypothetical protein